MTDKREPRVSISADSFAHLIAVKAYVAKHITEERESAMATARTLYAILRMNDVKVEFKWADPNFRWPSNDYCELVSVTIAGKRYKV